MLRMQLIKILPITLLLSGCASFNSEQSNREPAPVADSYSHSDIHELLAFGATISAMSETERSDVCKSLVNNQKTAPTDDKQLQLMLGRLLSDSCGDISKIINDIQDIKPNYANDQLVQRLITINTLALQRLQNLSKKAAADSRQKKSKSKLDSKDTTTEPIKVESRLLREKLEAIRTIEKQMDESVEGQ